MPSTRIVQEEPGIRLAPRFQHTDKGAIGEMLDDLLDWSAERGASTLLLQVLADNEAAQRLYARLGFRRHHSYRYLAAP